MNDFLIILSQYAHVAAGLAWLGGGFYTIFVQTPALMAAPPAARGPVLAQIAPRQIFYLLRLGEVTILTGVLRILTSGRGQELSNPSTRWAISLLVGIILAVVLLAIGHAILKPGITRLLALGPQAAQGDQAAAAEAGRIVARFITIGWAQVALGATIIFAMVLARFS